MSEWHDRQNIHLQSVPVHQQREFKRWHILTALAAVAAMTAIVCLVIWNDRPASGAAGPAPVVSTVQPAASEPGPKVPARKPVEKSSPTPDLMRADGTYLVGREIKTGTYASPGGPKCYWARLRDTSGEMAAIIAASYHRGRQVATIHKDDRAFLTDGCGPWEPVTP